MQNIIPTEPSNAPDYIRVVLDKTKNNRRLALIIFKKLFEELPEQLDGIEGSLKAGDYETAWGITHKLHGSVSFCGLTELQEPAKKLELCLTNKNYHTIAQDLLQLQQKVLTFTRYRDAILADLGNNTI